MICSPSIYRISKSLRSSYCFNLAINYKNGENSAVYALPLSIMLMFMVGGIVEWIAHPCNPVGLCVLLIGPALMMQMEKKN